VTGLGENLLLPFKGLGEFFGWKIRPKNKQFFGPLLKKLNLFDFLLH